MESSISRLIWQISHSMWQQCKVQWAQGWPGQCGWSMFTVWSKQPRDYSLIHCLLAGCRLGRCVPCGLPTAVQWRHKVSSLPISIRVPQARTAAQSSQLLRRRAINSSPVCHFSTPFLLGRPGMQTTGPAPRLDRITGYTQQAPALQHFTSHNTLLLNLLPTL